MSKDLNQNNILTPAIHDLQLNQEWYLQIHSPALQL